MSSPNKANVTMSIVVSTLTTNIISAPLITKTILEVQWVCRSQSPLFKMIARREWLTNHVLLKNLLSFNQPVRIIKYNIGITPNYILKSGGVVSNKVIKKRFFMPKQAITVKKYDILICFCILG